MQVKELSIFVRVAAVQNLSLAATELGLTAGTVSKRIQSLEDGLGVRLFERTTRSIRITEEGQRFLVHAERILAEVEVARAALVPTTDRPSGRLKISAPACLARRVVSPALASFMAAFPDIDLHADITDRMVNLHEEGYDAAIRVGVLTDCSLIAKRLAADEVVLVAAPSYLERKGRPQRPSDLSNHDCLLLTDLRSWSFTRGRESQNVKVAGRLVSDHGDLLRRAARDGIGILRTSRMAVADELASGRLVRVLPEYAVAMDAAIWVVHPSGKHVAPRLRALIDHLAEWCRTADLSASNAVDPARGVDSGAAADPARARPVLKQVRGGSGR